MLLRLVNSSKETWRENVRCWTAVVEADWWSGAEEAEGCVSLIRDDRLQDEGVAWNLMQSWSGRELTDDFPRQCVGDEGKLVVLGGGNGLVDGVGNWLGVDGAWRNAARVLRWHGCVAAWQIEGMSMIPR